MEDVVKVQVLMIYYDHWGRQELRARKIAHGMDKTLLLLEQHFQTRERTLIDGLKRMFQYLSQEDIVFLWTDFVEIFLQDMGGCFDTISLDEPYGADEDEVLFDRKVILEENLNITNSETVDMIYDNEFGYRNVLSVDAIVALL